MLNATGSSFAEAAKVLVPLFKTITNEVQMDTKISNIYL